MRSDSSCVLSVVGRGALSELTAQAAQAVRTERPSRWLRGDAPAGFQTIAGDGEFMGRGVEIFCGVVQDQVLDMNELAVDPQRGTGIGEVGAFNAPRPNRRTGDALVEAGQRAPTYTYRWYVGQNGWRRRNSVG